MEEKKSIIEKLGITPGPWELAEAGDGPVKQVPHKDYGSILTVVEEYNPDCVKFAAVMNDKNAYLISAAPEMLEDLIETVIKECEPSAERGQQSFDSTQKKIWIIEKATDKPWEEIKELLAINNISN